MKILVTYFVMCLVASGVLGRVVDKRKCPEVRAVPHFDLPQVGFAIINFVVFF